MERQWFRTLTPGLVHLMSGPQNCCWIKGRRKNGLCGGRRPPEGLSDGLTGRELAERLQKMDVKDAVFLDGGASSELIIDGEIINSPSAGRERMLASAFIIREKTQ